MSSEPMDEDAWAKASAEDIAAENARRREQAGQGPGSAADELRRLAEAVADRIAVLRQPAVTIAAETVISQVKQAVEPIKERNPEVFDHLAQAGSELLAAYRAAVSGHERRWTAGPGSASGNSSSERIDLD
jgi:hypothetical protein